MQHPLAFTNESQLQQLLLQRFQAKIGIQFKLDHMHPKWKLSLQLLRDRENILSIYLIVRNNFKMLFFPLRYPCPLAKCLDLTLSTISPVGLPWIQFQVPSLSSSPVLTLADLQTLADPCRLNQWLKTLCWSLCLFKLFF